MKQLLFLLLILFTSCVTPLKEIRPISDYKGCILIKRYENTANSDITDDAVLKCNDSIIKVELLEYDLDYYKENDTIQ